ncbi:Uncharacterised protein [Enterobacter hormaechei]|nr:Uncharacterised protein [Enterobacter hormaechei]
MRWAYLTRDRLHNILFNIIYIMRTSAQISQKSACNRHHGIKRSSLVRSFVFDRQPSVSLLSTPE